MTGGRCCGRCDELEAENLKLREANRRLQAEGPALERDKLIKALRAMIADIVVRLDLLVAQRKAALTVLRYWQPSVLSWCQRFPQNPVPEAVAAWAIVGPLLESHCRGVAESVDAPRDSAPSAGARPAPDAIAGSNPAPPTNQAEAAA